MTKYVDTHELSEPWAQRAWRVDFQIFAGLYTAKTRRNARRRMWQVRREAALERKLEAAQRRIAELESERNEYKRYYIRGIQQNRVP